MDDHAFSLTVPLQPRLSNAVYSHPGAISPFNDPDLQLIGIGTRIFLGGGIGYVAWGASTFHCKAPA